MLQIKTIFKKIAWVLNSFSVKDNGASARKLSAFYCIVIMGGYVTIKHTTDENADRILAIWLIAGAFFLGIITIQEIIKLRNQNSNTEEK